MEKPPVSLTPAEEALRQAALDYHCKPERGKISVTPTKPLANQHDLSLAYSPGVAYACLAIEREPGLAAEYTSRANLVGVVTNGTAVLGLGNIGPLAGKPVMEGKACLFKKFAGIDVFDIELAEHDPDKLVDIIAALEPTLGGINLEDIKAPECFYVERKLRERLSIPVFHDDQHGTAIISSAALLNSLELTGRRIGEIKLACSGAGAAALACLDLMVALGVDLENVFVVDSKGVLHTGRTGLDASKQRYAQATDARTLADIVKDADVFLGCSTAGVLTPEMVGTMAPQPIILALANPEPEIRPELAKQVRPDCIIATGRSDYPNQVNNVLCFPYIFRGALDAGATAITDEMKLACVREIAALAKAEIGDDVAAAYAGQELVFGPDYIIPKPFDRRLIMRIAPAVAEAAQASGVATRPIADLEAYAYALARFVTRTSMFMRPVFDAASARPKRVAYAEAEDERVLRAVQVVLDEGLASPILIGRPGVIAARVVSRRAALRAGGGRPGGRSGERSAFSRVLERVPGDHGPQRRHARHGEGRRAPLHDHHRRTQRAPRGRRRADLRPGRTLRRPPRHRARSDRPAGRRDLFRGAERHDAAGANAFHHRYVRQRRPGRGATRRDRRHGCEDGPRVRVAAESRVRLPLGLRFQRPALGAEDARCVLALHRTGAGCRMRRGAPR